MLVDDTQCWILDCDRGHLRVRIHRAQAIGTDADAGGAGLGISLVFGVRDGGKGRSHCPSRCLALQYCRVEVARSATSREGLHAGVEVK